MIKVDTRVTAETNEAITRIAAEQKRSRCAVMRIAIEYYIACEKPSNKVTHGKAQ